MTGRFDPAWTLCVTCGRDRRNHDRAERLVVPADRHRFETPSSQAARARRAANQSALPLDTEPIGRSSKP